MYFRLIRLMRAVMALALVPSTSSMSLGVIPSSVIIITDASISLSEPRNSVRMPRSEKPAATESWR